MNSKQKNYYNYIVDDLLSKVDNADIYYVVIDEIGIDNRSMERNRPITVYHHYLNEFRDYVKSRYGLTDGELNLIWVRFRNEFRKMFNV